MRVVLGRCSICTHGPQDDRRRAKNSSNGVPEKSRGQFRHEPREGSSHTSGPPPTPRPRSSLTVPTRRRHPLAQQNAATLRAAEGAKTDDWRSSRAGPASPIAGGAVVVDQEDLPRRHQAAPQPGKPRRRHRRHRLHPRPDGRPREDLDGRRRIRAMPKALLPSKLPTARVLTFGYDAYVADWRGVVSQGRIANHAWNLLTSLAAYREEDDTNERPIIFVCHSLGGLVCEDALSTSRQRTEGHLQNILRSTRGIAFLGTPHHGSGLARWAELLSRSKGIIKQTNTEIVAVLRRDSEVLARIQDGFHTMVQSRGKEGQPIEISCFFEELPLPGVGQVVPQDSAILPGYIPIAIHTDHMDMTKFASTDDPGFVAICGELRRWTKAAVVVTPPQALPDRSRREPQGAGEQEPQANVRMASSLAGSNRTPCSKIRKPQNCTSRLSHSHFSGRTRR
ncbi:uncharacterized protein B0I36DRAFT_52432 [Microdochium trichocladiopsis]|uniref:Uncharacterized protein n=1 Tax=Microdochium trichocladiopsis TaxID=1682393 RepID=A0A9P8XUC6_9PEZI|nr:uncharacterized protein B0I36DRAFT_52432 [Microdochium trichocladiopsis]KAH7012605.1 hypothetical protein B0I36DRAFT_52432 [Microdochium trichocladiopsis]